MEPTYTVEQARRQLQWYADNGHPWARVALDAWTAARQRVDAELAQLRADLTAARAELTAQRASATAARQAARHRGVQTQRRRAAARVAPPVYTDLFERVAVAFRVDLADLVGGTRQPDVVDARQAAALLLREAGASTTAIGAALGGRDHSTIVVACQRGAEKLGRGGAFALKFARAKYAQGDL